LDVNFWNPEGKMEIPDNLCLCDSFGGTISFFGSGVPSCYGCGTTSKASSKNNLNI
jgi:hypothetical protein